MITLTHYLVLASILFLIGIMGVLLRRNIIMILLSIELMLNAVNINLVAFSHYLQNMTGQVFVLLVITVAAAEAAIGLAILVVLFRNRETVDVDEINLMKW
jgi:NADH-quinone oxidoreductase subunit K